MEQQSISLQGFLLSPHEAAVRMLCSCDRYNFGDLLFPIVTNRFLSAIPAFRARFRCEAYGMTRSDLSQYGAVPSKGMRDLFRETASGDVVLLAGGENLAQTWYVMHQSLLNSENADRLAACANRRGADFAERLSRRRFSGRQQFPYILAPEHFDAGVRVMYNSMGGWPLRHYRPEDQEAIAGALHRASFLSVRDQESAAILREINPALNPVIAPDCVFLLPELFSKEALASRASDATRNLVASLGDFAVFQCHQRYGTAHQVILAEQLRLLAAQTGLKILLLPIGRIHSFNDAEFLDPFQTQIGDAASTLGSWAGIYDLAYVLSVARIFCGTSLHGVVTALAYGNPVVALKTDDPKLAFNLKSWDLAERFPSADVSELAMHAVNALNVHRSAIEARAGRLADEARANMQRLAECILAQ